MFKFPSKTNKYKCPICDGQVFQTSHRLTIDKNSKINWVSDSSFKLLGLNKADSYLITCFNCYHSLLVPLYDVSKLYKQEIGYEVRKKTYENYFPNKIYLQKNKSNSFDKIFYKSAKELKRFYKNLNIIHQLLSFDNRRYTKSFTILDYGGGDGYVSAIYSQILGTFFQKKVNYCVYDFNEWKNSNGEKFNGGTSKKFQFIILSHVLEHNHSPLTTLRDALKYADQDAIILIEVPDQRYLYFKGLLGSKFGLDYHVSFFSRKSLEKALNKCNINLIKTSYDSNTSYRGEDLETIIAVGRFNNNSTNSKLKNNKEISILYEFSSTLLSTFWKFWRKSKLIIIEKLIKFKKNKCSQADWNR